MKFLNMFQFLYENHDVRIKVYESITISGSLTADDLTILSENMMLILLRAHNDTLQITPLREKKRFPL